MTREIKFRAKSIDGQFVYGTPIKTHIGTYIVTEENPHVCSVYGYMEIDEFVKINEDTIGQFIGLHDKNGNEIYEGDIVKCNEFVYKVAYDDKRFASFVLIRKQDMFRHYFGEAMEASACEVIGNIYDNPELLKQEE